MIIVSEINQAAILTPISAHIADIERITFSIKLWIWAKTIWINIVILLAITLFFKSVVNLPIIDSILYILIAFAIFMTLTLLISFLHRKNVFKMQRADIVKVHMQLQQVVKFLTDILNTLNNTNDIIDNYQQLLGIISVDYDRIRDRLFFLYDIIQYSDLAYLYQNSDHLCDEIMNHYNYIGAEYIIQQYIIDNYEMVSQFDIFKSKQMYKYWIIASVLNNEYISEYKPYFDKMISYLKVYRVSYDLPSKLLYTTLLDRVDDLVWIKNNLGLIANYYDIRGIYEYILSSFGNHTPSFALQISETIHLHNKLMYNVMKVMHEENISTMKIIYLIFKGLFDKFPHLDHYLQSRKCNYMSYITIMTCRYIRSIFTTQKYYVSPLINMYHLI